MEYARLRELTAVGEFARSHHERRDGKGNAWGLRAGSVCGPAVGLFEHERVAKFAEEAVAELKRCAGTQFDPQIVNVFLRLLSERRDGTGQG